MGVVIVALLLVPSLAAAATGQFSVLGGVQLPERSAVTGVPVGIFARDTRAISTFDLHAAWAHVQVFEKTYAEISVGEQQFRELLSHKEPSWDAEGLTIRLVSGDHAGWLGIHPTTGMVRMTSNDPVAIEPVPLLKLGNGQGATDDAPGFEYYQADVTHPVISVETGAWNFTGEGSLKLMGPDVELLTPKNVSQFRTGTFTDSPGQVGQVTLRWIVVDAPVFDVGSRGALTRALADTTNLAWDGSARFTAVQGEVQDRGKMWDADDRSGEVDGAFVGTAGVTESGHSLTLALGGDMRSTTFGLRIERPHAAESAALWAVVLLGACIGSACIGAGGAIIASRRKKVRRPEAVPEDLMELASLAAGREDYTEALKWIHEARRASPTSRRLVADEAYYASKLGRTDQAVQLLKNELVSGPDAELDLLLARLLVQQGAFEDAAQALIRAIEAAPALLLEIEDDPDLAALLRRPPVAAALRRARRRLD